ncbi:endonuclease/exonuclease/phosphatase family protein [Prosthecobacter sp.]|uniref:endonuclease/exonuclease/phosphatase family protein n=1 Tax=Prosthecobacter sp. TaxID=1965333 RepID=UPI00248A11ED|nr:endonuclease/exonuclease/phosphatase family protein [Prosthecobacter sp.]MDI1312155.1 endonuclease/exonuclease/phosphatase family protein [Prosthecobacter sp.]
MSDDPPPADKPTLFKLSVSVVGFCEVIAFLSLTCTWLGSLGRHGWVFDLLSHFRLQYLVACAAVLLFALLRRRTSLVLFSLISLLWNAQIIHAYHQTAQAVAAPSEKPLRVMTFNVQTENKTPHAAIHHVLASDADIVCLLEVDETWRANLEPLRLKYPHRVEELNDGNFGIACYTRLPLKSLEARRYTIWRLPTLVLNLDHHGSPLTFIGAHTIPPMGGLSAHEWREHLSAIAALAASLSGEVIVAGDFNATPWCEGMRLLRENSGLDFRSADPVWPPTWGLYLPMMIPIDHVLTKRGLTVQKRTLGPETGSDHRSVTVEITRSTP